MVMYYLDGLKTRNTSKLNKTENAVKAAIVLPVKLSKKRWKKWT
jgi:predicted anti-sigma-YlaC factor YlaD